MTDPGNLNETVSGVRDGEAEPSAAFTPGPLRYCDGSPDMAPDDPGQSNPWEVYVPYKRATAYCRREADARLYAAAPDLLAALQAIENSPRIALGGTLRRAARAALLKALGPSAQGTSHASVEVPGKHSK